MGWLNKVAQQNVESILLNVARGAIEIQSAIYQLDQMNIPSSHCCEILMSMMHQNSNRKLNEMFNILKCNDQTPQLLQEKTEQSPPPENQADQNQNEF